MCLCNNILIIIKFGILLEIYNAILLKIVDIIKRIAFLWLSDYEILNELVAWILILYYFNELTWHFDMTLCILYFNGLIMLLTKFNKRQVKGKD